MARWQNQPNTEKREQVISLRMSGMTYKQIANAIGHKNESWVMTVCRENGLGGTSAWKDKRYAEMREYKAQGHTLKETALHFNVSHSLAERVCKGIAPQKADYEKASQTLKEYNERERNNRIERMKEKLDDAFEYVGGYDGSDGYVTIRCKQCGTEFERSAQAIRKRQVKYCPCCRKEQTERNAEQRQLEREEQKALRDAERERKRQESEQWRIDNTVTKVCRMCGIEFETTNKQKVCCSPECSKRYISNHRDKRIARDKRIDVGINALSLFKRDNGKCWICVGECNLNDYVIRDGVFIAGNWYPSVDHLVAVCDGGENSWENVKLAHRVCNTRRYYAEKHSPRSENA